MFKLIDDMPRLIQAGMGVHISCARLANTTSRLGALGIVSGVGLRHVVGEQIRAGDLEAIEIAKTFPLKQYVNELLEYAPGGAKHKRPFPIDHPDPRKGALPSRLSAITAYIEVMRAKQGHRGKIGINVMWKCATTVLPTIYGAMLAGVDALLCGAGVPMELPDILKKVHAGKDLAYEPLFGTGTNVRFSIEQDGSASFLERHPLPKLIPILSNFAFCKRIVEVWAREQEDARPFAFVLENHTAGGHNAPPRNRESFGEQDDIDRYFDKVCGLGVPVYVAGAFAHGGTREDFLYWTERGAYGLQVGSRFALCDESGLRRDLKDRVIDLNARGETEIGTSSILSPTGYPFKYVTLSGTLTDRELYEKRKRICNRGYLVSSHFETQPDGSVKETYICPAMPEAQYVKLGGDAADIKDRVCLCNALLGTGDIYSDEIPLVTLGESGRTVTERHSAREIVEDLLTPEYVACAEQALAGSGSEPLSLCAEA